jgi:hypothetical protein
MSEFPDDRSGSRSSAILASHVRWINSCGVAFESEPQAKIFLIRLIESLPNRCADDQIPPPVGPTFSVLEQSR